jgi:hypothetical protein
MTKGQIRVGQTIKNKYRYISPREKNFTTICLERNDKYRSLSPDILKDTKGHLVANLCHFSQIKEKIQPFTRQDTHNWPVKKHINYKTLSPEYLFWRHNGFKNIHPYKSTASGHMKKCVWNLNGLYQEMDKKNYQFIELDYISARKVIYCGIYRELLRTHPEFIDLKDRMEKGENLLLTEINCPGFEQTGYDTVLITEKVCQNLILETKYPFGYGIVISALLAGFEDIICDNEIKIF